jgi:hypothetical protein
VRNAIGSGQDPGKPLNRLAGVEGLSPRIKHNDLDWQPDLSAAIEAKGLFGRLATRPPPKRPPNRKKKTPARIGRAQGLSEQDGPRKGTESGAVPQARRVGRQSLSHLVQADAAVTVYDGQQFAGVVTKHGSTYEAHDAQGHFLGAFQSQREAVAACPRRGAS